jgi:hypothetical protein
LAAALAAAATPALAQVHGVPPSITSGSGGISSFPRASITSLGPYGWQNPPSPWPWQTGHKFIPCTIYSTTTQTGSICVAPLAGSFGSAPVVPFGTGVPGQNGLLPASPGGQRPDGPGGVGVIPVGIPFAVPYPELVPGAVMLAADPAADPVHENAVRGAISSTDAAVQPASLPAAPALAPTPEQKMTVLVLRDGRRLEVRNYAIVGNRLVNMSGSPGRVLLSDLDLKATVQANEERGVSFSLPVSHKDKDQDKGAKSAK